MAQRIFIKVVGFSDEERHLVNTLFRLSEQCRTMYQLWTPTSPEPARVALLDGQSWEARVEAESLLRRDLRLLWIGAHPPATVWRAFPRPVAWGDVVEGLDALFSAREGDVREPGPDSVMSLKQALIVSAERDERLYLRARLALARLTLADEAETASEALALARSKQYDVVMIDRRLPDAGPWALLRQLRTGRLRVPHAALTRGPRTAGERLRARMAGAILLEDPPDPERLDAWLSRIEVGSGG